MQHLSPLALQQIREAMAQATDSLTYYDYYLMYGRHYLIAPSHDSIIPYIDATLRFVSSLPEQTPRTRGLQAIATSAKASYLHLVRHKDTDSVISLYLQAYDLMMESDLTNNLPFLSANLGDAYVDNEDLSNASKWYRRALFLNDSLGLPKEQTFTLYLGLGRIYTMLRNFEEAQRYYEIVGQYFDEMKPNMQSYYLNNYGNYFYYHHDYQQALQTFRRFQRHLVDHHAEQNFDMFLCKINLADVFLNLGQTDSAQHYVAEAEDYFVRNRIDVGRYYAQTIRLGIAIKNGQYNVVRRILREPAIAIDDVDMQRIRASYLYRYYAAIGNYQQAYAYMEQEDKIGDSTRNEVQQMRTADILTRLAEDTIRLHHQLQLEQSQLRYTQTRTMVWGIGSLLVIVILAWFLYFINQRKRRLQQQLDIQTLRLANVRQRVSPHFVFNVLNSRIAQTNPEETNQLTMLAQLIRTNLDLTGKNVVTLAEELDFVKQYVAIESLLIGEEFSFDINAPAQDVLERVRIPSMLVQILVENAILHGLKNKEGQKVLSIHVEVDEQQTRICVIDNGPGFDIRRYNSNRSRTGLHIIRSTVSILNHENPTARMHFEIKNDNGCHAILTIPANIKYLSI